MFYSDYSELARFNLHTEGVRSNPIIQDGIKYAAPCTCLMYVDSDKKLRPIAIQLLPGGPIFTPKDTKSQWMYAKMVVRNADSQFHQLCDHWLNAHAISEVNSIAINRSLSRVHPLYRLLINHLKYTIAINTFARSNLVCPGGLAEANTVVGYKMGEFLKYFYSKMDLNKLDFPSRIEKCGFRKTKEGVYKGALDEFPYLDDGALVWDAIYDFVGEYLRIYYHSDDDVVNDSEFRDLIIELKEHGHPMHKDTFQDITTREELQKLVATIIWTASCHHSVVNFNQFNVFSFVPNSPYVLFQPIAQTKEIINDEYIMKSMPKLRLAALNIGLMHILSEYSEKEEFLVSSP